MLPSSTSESSLSTSASPPDQGPRIEHARTKHRTFRDWYNHESLPFRDAHPRRIRNRTTRTDLEAMDCPRGARRWTSAPKGLKHIRCPRRGSVAVVNRIPPELRLGREVAPAFRPEREGREDPRRRPRRLVSTFGVLNARRFRVDSRPRTMGDWTLDQTRPNHGSVLRSQGPARSRIRGPSSRRRLHPVVR